MKNNIWVLFVMAIFIIAGSFPAWADEPSVAAITHRLFQAVDDDGVGTYEATDKVILEGVVLNAPEQMIDPTPSSMDIGGQWQMYIQGVGDDHAGTAIWIGQNYSKRGGIDYTNEEFVGELCRINGDAGYIFNPGDLVRVTGWYMYYGGKMNVNETHQKDDTFNFTIELITPAFGMPQPDSVQLNQLKDETDKFIFDPNRIDDCEFYQGCLIRLEDVEITGTGNWGPGQTITVTDAGGLTFPVLLGLGSGFTQFDPPSGQIDVIGILDQEAPNCTECNYGYRIWVVNYDGNGLVLTDRGYHRGNLPGDVNADFQVDLVDFAQMAADWMKCEPGLCGCN